MANKLKLIDTKIPGLKVDENTGIFYIWTQVDLKSIRRSLKTKDPKLAEELFYAVRSKAKTAAKMKTKRITLRTAIDEYLHWSQYIRRVEKSTMGARRPRMNYLRNYFSDLPLTQFTLAHYENYLEDRLEQVSKETVNSDISTHQGFFNWCMVRPDPSKPYLIRNPIATVSHYKIEQRSQKAYPSPMVEDYIQYLYGEYHRLWQYSIITYCQALRRSETLKLRFPDIILDKRLMLLRNTKGKAERMIPIFNEAYEVLKDIKEFPSKFMQDVRTKYYQREIDNSDNLVFPDLNANHITKTFKRYRERYQAITGNHKFELTVQGLRHSRATMMFERGVHINQIQKFLGHKDRKTTAIYVGAGDEFLHQLLDNRELDLSNWQKQLSIGTMN